MEIKGQIVEILPTEEGMGNKGLWRKQTLILDTGGKYPKQVAVTVWGEMIDKHEVEQEVTAQVDISSRESKGRWYTEIKAWKIEVVNNVP